MAAPARSSQRGVANPLLNQVPWNAVLLKQRHSTATKRMRCPNRYFEPPAERLKNVAIHISIHQRRSILRFEDPTTLPIARIFLDHLHHFRIYVDFPEACLRFRGHFLVRESGPSNTNNRVLEIEIINVRAEG
jgi:hypothetical protein